MSPYSFFQNGTSGFYSETFVVYGYGEAFGSSVSGDLNYTHSDLEIGVRPVISLKSCVKWKSGEGTSDNPYTVDTLSSTCYSAEN